MTFLREITRFPKKSMSASSTGNTSLGRTENGMERFYPKFATIEVKAVSGIVSLGSISIGTNSTSYDNILSATLMTSLNAVNKVLTLDVVGVNGSIAPNTEIFVRVSGIVNAAVYTVEVTLFGFYQ